MTGHVRVGGAWKDLDSAYVRVGGSWKAVEQGWTRVGGVWREWFSASNPAMELISSQTLSSDTASVTLSSIPQTYKHLELRVTGKSTKADTAASLIIRINNISTASQYQYGLFYGTGSAPAWTRAQDSAIYFSAALGASLVTEPGMGIYRFNSYTTTSVPKFYSLHGSAGVYTAVAGGAYQYSGSINSIPGAIQTLTLSADGGNLVAGTTINLYGILG